MTRHAISPLFAIKIFSNGGVDDGTAVDRCDDLLAVEEATFSERKCMTLSDLINDKGLIFGGLAISVLPFRQTP